MKGKHSLIILLILVVLFTGCTSKNNLSMEPLSRTEFMMDTVMTIKIYDKMDEGILDKAFKRLEEIEKKMSATLEASEINKINAKAGIKAVEVSSDTYFVLEKAKYHAEISAGAYEPTIGPLVRLWDIQAEEDGERNWIPEQKDIELAQNLVNYKNLELLENNQVFLKEKGMRLDLGGIVKGYAADEVRKILQDNGANSGIIDLGGNIYAHGVKAEKIPWNIGIQNPFETRDQYLGIVELSDRSIVTSGDYERFFEYDGRRYHHIIDRETGYPTNNEIAAVSIISNQSLDCDALSTSLFVLGLDRGIELINSINDVEAIFFTKDRLIYLGANIKDDFKLKEGHSEFKIREY